MTDVATEARTAARRDRPSQTAGFDAKRMLDDLLAFEPQVRAMFIGELGTRDTTVLIDTVHAEMGTPYGLWRDDPVGFALGPLRQTMWSTQRRILRSVEANKKTAVPSSVGAGKTKTAAVLTAWWGCVWPPGIAVTVTTAHRFRQVQRQIWPEIRMLHSAMDLPGKVDTTQWKVPLPDGTDWVTAYGFAAPDYDETSVQGVHFPRLLVIADEAGGIGHIIGKAFESILTGEHTRGLFIGNPATDVEGSWFEGLTQQDDTNTIPISIFTTPRFTGELMGPCLSCPAGMPEHDAREHLTEPDWEVRVRRDYGEDSPYYQARALARFPRGGPSRVLPGDWLDAAVEIAREGNDRRQIIGDRLGTPFPFQPKLGAWIRLGVDVAAGGGDELAIARAEGDIGRLVHHESGIELANSHYAAGKVLEQIRVAEDLRVRLGTEAKVRVKVDAIGIGLGVCSILEAWGSEGIHDAEIVRVTVSESPEDGRREDGGLFNPMNKRAEMWLALRQLLQPDERTGDPAVALDIDDQTKAQLGAPKLLTSSGGFTQVEKKDDIKKRLGRSPDRGEAVLLSFYEPFDLVRRTRRTILAGA